MTDKEARLVRLAKRARNYEQLLANAIFTYQELEGLTDVQLASKLNCQVSTLPRLALCRKPQAPPLFLQDVQKIVAYTGVDATVLANIIRAVDAHQELRSISASSQLLAARDRDIADEQS